MTAYTSTLGRTYTGGIYTRVTMPERGRKLWDEISDEFARAERAESARNERAAVMRAYEALRKVRTSGYRLVDR